MKRFFKLFVLSIIIFLIVLWFRGGSSEIVIDMNEQNNSGETGTVTLREMDGKTKVIISLAGVAGESEHSAHTHPAHIHDGACPTPGAVKYPLTNVVDGKSETIIDVSLNDLIASLPLAVNAHKSATELQVYVSCGDIVE